ncbi:MAG TPA: hypothetical protein VE130_05075 [Nitrososphaeraceae archaeon]|nr:hypothetical protein [Nitrososphaeraceae archaeon]
MSFRSKSRITYLAAAITAISISTILFLEFANTPIVHQDEGDNPARNLSSVSSPTTNALVRSDKEYYQRGNAIINNTAYAEGKQLPAKNERYLCGTPFASATEYIQEYYIPLTCSQPVGITVDSNNRIWFVATWSGYLVVFDPESHKFINFIEIPNWKTKGTFGSMVWSMEFDKEGNLWFTDQVNDAIWRYFVYEDRFEMYKVPTAGSYPQGITFDRQGKLWFSEIFGKRIGVLDPDKVADNTTEGIIEYLFEEIEYETMGPVLISSSFNDTIWFSAVTYPEGGNLISFNPANNSFTVHEFPASIGVPIGIAEDNEGILWINDHATNLFLRFDPRTSQTTKYSTSLPTSRNDTTTLPYWNTAKGNKIWFNEHEGNAMAYFDTINSTLVEYQIPTRGLLWGNTSNPLKFTIDKGGSVWFTEWSENKIGVLQSNKIADLPIWLTVSKDELILDTSSGSGDSLKINVYSNSTYFSSDDSNRVTSNSLIKLTTATSITQSGKLWNITTNFDTDTIYLNNATIHNDNSTNPYSIEMEVKPIKGLMPGNYTLTIGARYGSISYSKIVDLVVTE